MEAYVDMVQKYMNKIIAYQKQIEEASKNSVPLPELEQMHDELKKECDELAKTLEDDKKSLEELQHSIERKKKIQCIIGNILQAQEVLIEKEKKRMNK